MYSKGKNAVAIEITSANPHQPQHWLPTASHVWRRPVQASSRLQVHNVTRTLAVTPSQSTYTTHAWKLAPATDCRSSRTCAPTTRTISTGKICACGCQFDTAPVAVLATALLSVMACCYLTLEQVRVDDFPDLFLCAHARYDRALSASTRLVSQKDFGLARGRLIETARSVKDMATI